MPDTDSKGSTMTIAEFSCTECGQGVKGPVCAISMTINCPSCDRHVTAYKTNDE